MHWLAKMKLNASSSVQTLSRRVSVGWDSRGDRRVSQAVAFVKWSLGFSLAGGAKKTQVKMFVAIHGRMDVGVTLESFLAVLLAWVG